MVLGYVKEMTFFNNGLPYSLTKNYIELKGGNKSINYEDIKNLNITLIAEYQNEEYLGFLDTDFYFQKENIYTVMGITRYFSESDYRSKTKSSIFVTSSEDVLKCNFDIKNIANNLVDDYIFCVNNQISSFKSPVKDVLNYTSIEDLPNKVYIDSSKHNDLTILYNKLINLGYEEMPKDVPSLTQSISNGGKANIFLACVLSLYIIFAIVCYYQLIYNKKTLSLHSFLGGGMFSTLKNTSLIYFKGQLIIPFLIFPIYSFYRNLNLFIAYRDFDIVILIFFHLIVINLTYISLFYVFFKESIQLKEVKNVK